MKLIAILLFVACLQVSANGYSQITLNESGTPFKKVIKKIQKQSGYNFLCTYDLIQQAGNITAKVDGLPLEQTLDKVLKGTGLSYTIIGKTIIIREETKLENITVDKEPAPFIPIKGKITDEKGAPLQDVSIVVKGTKKGTSSNTQGNFSIEVEQGEILEFTLIGYKPTSVKVGTEPNISIVMEVSVSGLNEIVVTGYTNQKKESVTGSVGVISGKQLTDVATPNVSNLLQGKVSGVDVVNSSGRPGSKPSIIIRGRSTISSTTAPLWVVDGAILPDESAINPADIETISILKDAASATLYGSRAANGVIVVTTKMAKGAEKKDFQVSGRTGVTLYNMGKFELMDATQLHDYWKSFANQASLPSYFKDSLKLINTDWVDIGSQNALTQDYNATYTGVSNNARIYTGVNYYKEEGTVKGYTLDRLSGRLNLDYKLSSKFVFKPKLTVAYTETDNREHSVYDMFRNMPWDKPYDVDGKPINARGNGVVWYGRDLNNYLYDLQWNYSSGNNLNITTNVDFQYDINKYFSFKSTNNINYLTTEGLTYVDPRSFSGLADVGRIANTTFKRTTRFTNQMLTYKNKLGSHAIDALIAYEYNDLKSNNIDATGKGIVPGITVLSGAATPIATTGTIGEYAFRSYLFNASYAYDNRYSAQVSLRSDGSSRFAKKYGTFFSVGGAWNIHNESFFDVNAIDYLKIRANYGGVGNTPTDYYGYYDLFSVSTQYNGSPSAFPSVLGNKALSWERSYNTDIGIEIGLLDKLDLTIDLYKKNTSDLVYAVSLPAISGYNQQLQNIGSVVNKGIEASLTYHIIKTSNIQWSVDILFGSNKNHVTELYQSKSQLNGNQIYKEGEDINTWYLPVWAGVNPDNGDPQWEMIDAANGNKTFTSTFSTATLQTAGTSTPDFFGGINTNFSAAGFSLRINTAYRKGSLIYHTERETFDNDGAYPTYNNMVLAKGWSRWSPENRNATHPLAYYGGNKNSNKPSTRYLEDGSFFRVRNITLGYTLPVSFVQKLKAKNIQASLSLDNLLTFTKFSGLDPETISYPQPKRITLGLSVGF